MDKKHNWKHRAYLTAVFILIFGHTAHSNPRISNEVAVKCIVGEASNQGYQGMLALAGALRNRGTTKGVYGCGSTRKEAQWVYESALKAWNESDHNDITNGATHWENIKAFGTPYWVKSMVKTFEYKDHVFYKEIK